MRKKNYLEQISKANAESEDPLVVTTELAVRVSTTVPSSVVTKTEDSRHDQINMRELLGEEAIGDFDQIIIDHDNDGSIIVTKKRKVLQLSFSGFSNHFEAICQQ